MNQASIVTVIVVIAVLFLCCCLCFAVVFTGALGLSLFAIDSSGGPGWSYQSNPTPTPVVVRPPLQPEPLPTQEGLTDPTPHTELQLVESHNTLETLEQTIVPVSDPLALAERLEGKTDIPVSVAPPAVPYQVGDRHTFWVTNVDTNVNFEIETILRYETAHAYYWIEEGVTYNEADLRDLAETFEQQIYPTNRAFFGSEWKPGVDGDPHLYIVYASDLGYSLAGYFSSIDEYHPQAHQYSNAHETFMLNADTIDLDEEFTYGVLAHEFQHMIHWYQDRNEDSWLNEGFSELAAFLNGYDVGGFDRLYISNPDLQLTDWPNDSSSTSPHYGASFLFVTYFLDRFGEQATKAVVAHPLNGMESFDAVLAEIGAQDPLTGAAVAADDIFLDWTLTNYLLDESIGDGRYIYQNYASASKASQTETIRSCDPGFQTRDVSQYGVDYIRITCDGSYRLHFEGSIQVGVLPADPYSGEYAFWSNKGDESNMTLTQRFDFSDHAGPLTLSYWTWYDLEKDYDYLYLVASLDGLAWEILRTPSGTGNNPSGNSYGWGYNGLSGGEGRWIQESIDLSRFAGQVVHLRFEYVTDAAVNGEGFLLDDLSIAEIGYFADFEQDAGGWEAAGFVRIQNLLPQYFRLALITYGDTTSVEYLDLASDQSLELDLDLSGAVDEVVLVVTATTRFTRERAAYRFEFQP